MVPSNRLVIVVLYVARTVHPHPAPHVVVDGTLIVSQVGEPTTITAGSAEPQRQPQRMPRFLQPFAPT